MLFILFSLYIIFGLFSEVVWRRAEEDDGFDDAPWATSAMRVALWPLGWFFYLTNQ